MSGVENGAGRNQYFARRRFFTGMAYVLTQLWFPVLCAVIEGQQELAIRVL